MTVRQVALLVGFALMLSVGQILFKVTADAWTTEGGSQGFAFLFTRPEFWGAIVLYAGSTLLWIWLLRDTELSKAYPFVALAFVFVPVLSQVFLSERLTAMGLVGSVFIVAGIVISQV